MKRFGKLVLGGIEMKMVALIMAGMLLVGGVFLGVMLMQGRLLTQLTEETNARQLSNVTGTTAEVLDTVITENMDRITQLEAKTTDEMFQDLAIRVQMVAEYAQKLLENPDNAPRMPWLRPDASKDGTLFVKVLLADGLEEADVEDKLGLIANLSDMMVSVCNAYGADNIWFTLPEGATLMADVVPSQWVNEDGSYVTYDAVNRYWYKQAKEEGKLVFSDVEYDRRTGAMCVTCAVPVYGADGTLLGVAGADLYLTEMQRTVAESAKNGGYLMIVNQDGHVIISPEEIDVFQVLNSEKAVDLRASEQKELAALVGDALHGKTDVRKVQLQDAYYYMMGVPMETVGWALISVFSEAAAEQPILQLQESFQKIQMEAVTTYRERSAQREAFTWILLCVLFVIMLTGTVIAGKKIVKPLYAMTKRIAELREGYLEFKMDDAYRTGDEVEVVAEAVADLSRRAMEYIEQVKKVTAEKERIGTELYVAHQIQKGMLPGTFPAFPGRKEFDLYASMDPAKEIGGDFYDFFLIDEDHLALVMADVSGKGVPAALFMMVSKVILKYTAKLGKSVGEILSMTNNTICGNNKMEMFVTVWMGILEIPTGKIVAANAGHEYPTIYRNGKSFELLKDKHGFVVGGMEGVRYKEYEIMLEPGDKLFLYTDGVPEASNAEQEFYGTTRMIEALNDVATENPEKILKHVRKSVDAFVDKAEQFDDLTMLCLEYKGV